MKRNFFFFVFIIIILAATSGCSEKTGILPDPVAEPSYVTPTIQNLQVKNSTIAKCEGGILTISCDWTSPRKVSTATAYLGFVKTIKDPTTEPVGIIASQPVETDVRAASLMGQTVASDTCLASDTAAFFARYAEPIYIPTRIGTDDLSGRWEVEIPFAPEDTRIA
ncbi:MAG: hypothetical protein PWR01_4208, partial [Clostridiales bacterium]|nr:hypothetical protein [Clostridiales bacterium]MDN5283135.1 hypothetical protein [Candidatus Ozemobacter sp.]